MAEIQKILLWLWLTKKEADVYIWILERGSATITQLSRAIKIPRTSLYAVLERLSDKGFVSSIGKWTMKLYQGLSPHDLYKKQQYLTIWLESILPDLLSLQNAYQYSPNIQYFDGYSGVETIWTKFLDSSSELYGFMSQYYVDHWFSIEYKSFLQRYLKERVKRKLKANIIISDSDNVAPYIQQDEQYFRETLFIKHGLFQLDSDIVLFDDNKVALIAMTPTRSYGTIMTSKQLYDTLLSIFKTLRSLWTMTTNSSLEK